MDMRKSFILLFLLFLPFSSPAAVERVVLENGLRVVLCRDPSRPVVAYQIWVGTGSADEAEGEAGVAHLIEHMIFKPTDAHPQGVARLVEGLGGRINAFTSYEYTVFHLAVRSRFHLQALRALADAVLHPRFDPEELSREKEVVLEEIRMGEDQPRRRFHRRLWRTAFRVHPYGRPVIGYRDTVSRLRRDDLLRFWRKWYVPPNMAVVAVGDFQTEEVLREVQQLFGGMRGSPPTRARPKEPPQKTPRAFVQGGLEEYYLALGFHIPDIHSPDFYPLEVLGDVLASGRASRLERVLKEQKGLVTSVYAYSFLSRDPGLFVIGASPVPGRAVETLGSLLEELRRVATQGVTVEELQRAKKGFEAAFLYDRETVQGEAETLGYFETILGDARRVSDYLRGIREVTPEEIRGVAARYFRRESLSLGLMSPRGQEVEVGDLLALTSELAPSEGLKRTVLPNGITLLFLRDPSLPIVGMTAAFLGGLRYETAEKAGLSQLLSRVLTRGTTYRDALKLAEEVEGLGAQMRAFAGRNSFGLELKGLSRDFRKLLEIAADVIMNPTFPERELEKARQEQLSALRRQREDLTWRAFTSLRSVLYEGHPYGMNPLGTEETVKAISREDLVEYWRDYATPRGMVLAIVGDLSWEEVRAEVERAFRDFRREGAVPPKVPRPKRPKAPLRKEILYGEGEQVHMIMGFLGASLKDADRYPLEVLGAVLGRRGGRFFRRLRDEMALGYEVFFFVRNDLDPGYLGAYLATSPEKVPRAIEGMKEVLQELLRKGLLEEEVQEAKAYLLGNYELDLQGVLNLSSSMALNELYGLGGDFFRFYPQRIEAVTPAEVLEVARRYIDLDAYALVILSPSR